MNYFDYLKQMLEPLGLYDLQSGAGAAELQSIGALLDEIFEDLEKISVENFPHLAEDFGLSNYEEIFPFAPSSSTLEDRRRSILSLLRVRNGAHTIEMLDDTLSGCGIMATVEERDEPLVVMVRFPECRGIPADIDILKNKIEHILPCHLIVLYEYIYSTWEELMESIPTWQSLQTNCNTWKELEIYI